MTEPIVLYGCAPEPLIHYLKALGVLRLVAEQLDPQARGAWLGDAFVLEANKTKDEIVAFFLNEYCPTPIVAPWNNGSGFHTPEGASDAGKKVVNFRNIKTSTNQRLESYRETIHLAENLLAECLTAEIQALPSTKRSEALKPSLIPLCRNTFNDDAVRWVDAVCFLADKEKLGYPPLLGSAGNDGNQEFSLTFMGCLHEVLPTDGTPRKYSERQLRSALLGETGFAGAVVSPGQFNPRGTGGANATSGAKSIKADNLSNPWDYVLAIEGSLLFAGAAVRRLAAGARSAISYPFQVDSVDLDPTVAPREENRGDLFLPLWERPAAAQEISQLFSEGRVRLGRKQARDTLEFARAIAALGIDRGIVRFNRYSLLTRNGTMQFASRLSTLETQGNPKANLLDDFQVWLRTLRRVWNEKNPPAQFLSLQREISAGCYGYCSAANQNQQKSQLASLLISLGKAEKELAVRPNFQDPKSKKHIPPIRLRLNWLYECHDDSVGFKDSFNLAASIASICGADGGGSIRENIEPVNVTEKGVDWAVKSVRAVWGNGLLEDNLAAVLHRRSIEARANSLSHPVLTSSRFASLKTINAFLNSETDDARVEELLRGLILLDWQKAEQNFKPRTQQREVAPSLPRAYALLKLLFLPDGKFQRDEESETITIKHEPAIVPLLKAGRVQDALQIAYQRLQASGLTPATREFHYDDSGGTRLAAALLIPIDEPSIRALAELVLRDKPEDQ
jgi:CRISPR-associated protein Csx17